MVPERAAFVAMKFDDMPWRDKRYIIISEVLREAGFQVTRADEIRSSEVSVADVAQYLKESEMVIVDLSGDSHNVSYELGYCHGLGRSPETLILLCRAGEEVPFNYAHFRHYRYRDLRDLRSVLRYRLELSTPLTDEQTGYALAFNPGTGAYGADVATAVLDGLQSIEFTGRCEFYGGDLYWINPPLYAIGLGIKHADRKRRSDHNWIGRLAALVDSSLKAQGAETTLDHHEVTMMRGVRHDLLSCGVAEFENGFAKKLLNPDDADSWFSAEINERTTRDGSEESGEAE